MIMGTKAVVLLMGYFMVEAVELDYDGRYNVLLEQRLPNTGHLVSLRSDKPGPFIEGKVVTVDVVADCNAVGELREGEGKMGSSWRAEDDWYWYATNYVCNAIEWKIHHE